MPKPEYQLPLDLGCDQLGVYGFGRFDRLEDMVWVAAVLGVFLFYKYVERPHKIIFFKIAGGCVAIGLLGIGGFLAYDQFKPKQNVSEDISVEYSYHLSKIDKKLKQKIAESLFNDLISSKSYILNGLSASELPIAKHLLFGAYLSGDNPLSKIIKSDDKEMNYMFDSWDEDKEKAKIAKAKYDELQNARLASYLSELSSERKAFAEAKSPLYFSYILVARVNSLDPDLKPKYESQFTQPEAEKAKQIRSEIDRLQESIVQEFNKMKSDTEISFKVCNKENRPLNSYYFYVSGFEKGRSTATTLDFSGIGSDTKFEGDIIIAPKQCSSITWTGKYRLFDRYELKYITGTWAAN